VPKANGARSLESSVLQKSQIRVNVAPLPSASWKSETDSLGTILVVVNRGKRCKLWAVSEV